MHSSTHTTLLLLSEDNRVLEPTYSSAAGADIGTYILQGRCERELESEAIEQSERGPCVWGYIPLLERGQFRNCLVFPIRKS